MCNLTTNLCNLDRLCAIMWFWKFNDEFV